MLIKKYHRFKLVVFETNPAIILFNKAGIMNAGNHACACFKTSSSDHKTIRGNLRGKIPDKERLP